MAKLLWDTIQNCSSNDHFLCSHAIFDLDDTLLLTEHLYNEIINKMLASYDCGYLLDSTAELERRGVHGFDLAEFLIRKFKLPFIKEDVRNDIIQHYPDYLPKAKPCPGAERLIEHLAKHKIPMAIAATSSDISFRYKIQENMDLIRQFDHILLGNSDRIIRRGTPHPEMYVVCAARFVQRPSSCSCVVFDDSIYSIRAAASVGMKTVFIPRDPNTPYAWKYEANLTINSLDEFTPEMFGFPPF